MTIVMIMKMIAPMTTMKMVMVMVFTWWQDSTCSTSETGSEQTYCKQGDESGLSKKTPGMCVKANQVYLEYVIRLGVGPEGKEGREAVEERQGGEGDRPAPVSSLSR